MEIKFNIQNIAACAKGKKNMYKANMTHQGLCIIRAVIIRMTELNNQNFRKSVFLPNFFRNTLKILAS